MDYLSNIELYYTPPSFRDGNNIKIEGEECSHIAKVMRHSVNDLIHITDGIGHIFECKIENILKDHLDLAIEKVHEYENKFHNITFCIPKLKNPERFEFALEKSTELGITNFIIFESIRTISKANKIERWNKILLSAMKQSLRSYLPQISLLSSFSDLIAAVGEKIIFEQNTEAVFKSELINPSNKYLFIFGPEGGLSEDEIKIINKDNVYKLAGNRLRTETAVLKCASILTTI